MRLEGNFANECSGRRRAFTLVEVVIALGISTLVFSGIILGYSQVSRRAEWSGYSLAAQAMAVQELESARAAIWDPTVTTNISGTTVEKNELTALTNLTSWSYNTSTKIGTGYSVAVLDIPIAGTNIVVVTNYVTVRMLYLNNATNLPYRIQMVQVDTVWPWRLYSVASGSNAITYVTNSIANYMAPDNRNINSL